ncbi:carboxypeptidase-like regulatory domain-containing protein, partial [bacterium]|nr:carboxypeptidase-like regulatory domain-containing protein [bacterium]
MAHGVRFLGMIALALCLCWGQASAGTTGKITGTVKDSKGQALAGVNVKVEGTTQGAVTDVEGKFLILLLDPGQYALTASIIGYNKQTKRDVGVSADRTTPLDFELAETAVALGEVTVTAERPPVEVDRTSSTYTMDARMIEQTPLAKDVSRLLELQGGVNLDGKLSIRGNQGTDGYWGGNQIEIYVDGVPAQGLAMYK